MGQMPVLEVDGHRVHQSISMSRYVAKRVGLAGANDWENLVIDTAVDTINDFRLSMCIRQTKSRFFIWKIIELSVTLDINEEIAVVSYEPDDEVKEKKQITLTTEVIPFYLEKLENIVKENNGFMALCRVRVLLMNSKHILF